MNIVLIVAIVAAAAVLIGRQMVARPVDAGRLLLLPAALLGYGGFLIAQHVADGHALDVALIGAGAAVALAIGVGQGAWTRLTVHQGRLWGQLTGRGLMLWVAFFASRGALTLVAHGTEARLAASFLVIPFVIGANRLGHALTLGRRAAARRETDAVRPASGQDVLDRSGAAARTS
ncbi:MAG: hypothetical protein M3O55_01180 [Actinomycetota bacterium]|nr:hypothetical protein [Actinomycetota bacterium]